MGKPVLLTGASGALGRVLAAALPKHGYTLRLTDIAPFPDDLPAGCTFTQADLTDGVALLRLAEGCGAVLHFGGISVERPFEEVFGPNLRGLYHVFEAARREHARVVFASSNHAIGFHDRSETLDAGCPLRPDGFYGLSKAYGELMAGLYWDKHGTESVSVRIGSCYPEPKDARMLATWLSFGDLTRLMVRAIEVADIGRAVIWGASANAAMTWWGRDDRDRLGWSPADSADPHAGRLAGAVSGDPVVERYQGGAFTRIDYSRQNRP